MSIRLKPHKAWPKHASSKTTFLEKLGKPQKRGPMGQAFFTRNPLLPREYFVPKGVDAFVAKMNEGVEHSLLDCPGRQTIQVATFRGKTILQTSAKEDAASKSFWGGHKKDDKNPLVEAAENAHLLAKELRSHGYDAYEFHDRTESIVTIGAFAQAAQQLPDGRVVAIPEVQKIIQTFDAGFDTPADPLSPIGNDSRTQRLGRRAAARSQCEAEQPAGPNRAGNEPEARKNPERPRQEREGRADHPDGYPSASHRSAEAERFERLRGLSQDFGLRISDCGLGYCA